MILFHEKIRSVVLFYNLGVLYGPFLLLMGGFVLFWLFLPSF